MTRADRPSRLLLMSVVVCGALSPVSCIPMLFVVNTCNPMQLIFITEFEVENRTDRLVRVTPIGTIDPAGRRAGVPVYRSAVPAIRSRQRGGFAAPPGQSITIKYDWDDVNLSELVVEMPDGSLRQLVVDPSPTTNQFYRPRETHWVIDDASLTDVPPDVREAWQRATQPGRGPAALVLMSAPLPAFVILLRRYRAARRRLHSWDR